MLETHLCGSFILVLAMPRQTKQQNYSACIDAALQNLVCSLILEDPAHSIRPSDNGLELEEDEDDFEEPDATTLSNLLELAAIDWISVADSFYSSGPGSRGPYDRIPKSVDFFSCCLQAPDREFRHMFR